MNIALRMLLATSSIVALVACDNKSSGGAAPTASTSATPAASTAPAVASGSAAPSSSAAASAAPGESGAWNGTYKSVAGALSLPDGPTFKDVGKWQGDDASVGLGEGALSLSVDGATGQVTGTADGALGAVVIDGVLRDGQLTATITRKDPGDRGLTGTAIGKVAGEKIDGTMSLSLPEANVLRKATFSLAKKS